MKVVILAGGRGTRLGAAAQQAPKPMALIGGKPILWHIMRQFAQQGFTDFVVAAGYRSDVIDEYIKRLEEPWLVKVVDTGLETGTAGRIQRLAPLLHDETFIVAYGDGLCDVDVRRMLQFHREHGKAATMLAVHPPSRFGRLTISGDRVERFEEKGVDRTQWVNGSIFIFEPSLVDVIEDDASMLEQGPLPRLAEAGQLVAFKHESFWQCMDYPHEQALLERRWLGGDAPWTACRTPKCENRKTRSSAPGRRILVTGHRGYLGCVLTPMLLQAGHEVHGLDSGLYDDCGFRDANAARALAKIDEVPAMTCDVRDVPVSALRGFDVVVHLAGLCNDPLGDMDPDVTFDINYRAAVELARKAREAGVSQFLQASTCSVYGGAGEDWISEDSALSPLTPYAESKMLAERDIAPLAAGGFWPTFLRMGTVYGYSPRLRGDLVVNNLVAHAHTSGKIVLNSLGTSWRPLLHVEDAARAFCAAINQPHNRLRGAVVNVGTTEENYRVANVAGLVQAAMHDVEVVFAPGAAVDPRNYRVRCERIRTLLPQFQPAWTVAQGVDQLVKSYRAAALTGAQFHSGRFMRLRHIQNQLHEGALAHDLRAPALLRAASSAA
ncbi:MAG: NAD-dependent epimerase/dehydratase family protein [Planctomycetales bacterium]|nr:NAD-dependent epimerase/dehydratase family protein [Planctomycetales bacterium]